MPSKVVFFTMTVMAELIVDADVELCEDDYEGALQWITMDGGYGEPSVVSIQYCKEGEAVASE